ncbi:hypothetical protein, partial [Bacillus paralicheniformis]|uniref:hypothetical protein n=1 Tax=Bacillus paralicheniformis TaxID=1648923 RepID=UPI003D219ACD
RTARGKRKALTVVRNQVRKLRDEPGLRSRPRKNGRRSGQDPEEEHAANVKRLQIFSMKN